MLRARWRVPIRDLTGCPAQELDIVDRFHTQWHVSNHLIRELVGDDELVMDMLWVWLPRYDSARTCPLSRREASRSSGS